MPPAVSRCLVVIALSFCAVAAAQDEAGDALRQCLAQIEDPAKPAAPSRLIEASCPGLREVLEDSPYATWLPEGLWDAPVSKERLADLHDQLAWESAAREPRTLDTSGMAAALSSLGKDAQAGATSWWQRLRDWLRSRLQRDPQAPPGWLFQWLENLARYQTALRISAYALCALIVLAAAFIVLRELKAAGVFGSGRAPRTAAGAAASESPAERVPGLRDLEAAEPGERPSMLLTMIVAALARQADRSEDRTSTHRELARRVELETQPQRSAFERLLGCAERLRYAAGRPARADIDAAVDGGLALLRSLLPGQSRA